MPGYLTAFRKELEPYKGSLVRVKTVKDVEPKAKEYLHKLAKEGSIERVKWGWYWIPTDIKDVWDFLEKDTNFKIVSAQTAASFYNNDFVHRDVYVLRVKDKSYGKALKEFGGKRGWNFEIEYVKDAKIKYRKFGNLLVEGMEENIIDCLKNWAFADAFATLYENKDKINLGRLYKESYWKRIPKTNVRAKQVLEYGFHRLEAIGKVQIPHRETRMEDAFVKREIDEAIERVVELG